MKLNKEQIIKSLECCRYGGRCSECACFDTPNCQAIVNENAILLINELIEENQEVHSNWQKLKKAYDEVCIETIDEFEKDLSGAFNFGYTILEKSICDIVHQVAINLKEKAKK